MRIMPATMVATLILLYRKGISIPTLAKKMSWLGMALLKRGVTLSSDEGLPSETTLKIGLQHLYEYLTQKRDILAPKVLLNADKCNDYSNFIMLGYYRNPLNWVFFNEAIIVCSLLSSPSAEVWSKGMPLEDLFLKACWLAKFLKREEVLKERIEESNRAYFDKLIDFMQEERLLTIKDGIVVPKSSGEATMLLIGSICWPMIDSYYIVAVLALSLCKKKDEEETKFGKDA